MGIRRENSKGEVLDCKNRGSWFEFGAFSLAHGAAGSCGRGPRGPSAGEKPLKGLQSASSLAAVPLVSTASREQESMLPRAAAANDKGEMRRPWHGAR